MKKHIALLGGDMRQVRLAQLLLEDGHDVVTWGLEKGDAPNAVPLHLAQEREILLFPLPMCLGGGLNLPLTDMTLGVEQLWPRLRYDQLLLGGMTGELSARLAADFGLTLLDYYHREETQVANAVPTAEGAIQRAMEVTERTLHGSSCLVIGFGRVGKLLAHQLQGMHAHVAVSARKYSDLAWIRAYGYESLRTNALAGELGEFEIIFNTVPAIVLDGERLRELNPDCVLIDLASVPGGVDLDAARALDRHVIRAPGLPGLVAPRAAAAAIRDSIYHILEERGEPI